MANFMLNYIVKQKNDVIFLSSLFCVVGVERGWGEGIREVLKRWNKYPGRVFRSFLSSVDYAMVISVHIIYPIDKFYIIYAGI